MTVGWLGLPADHKGNNNPASFTFAVLTQDASASGTGAPPATRIGDRDIPHCSGMVRAQGSENVLVNNIPWSRVGDSNTPHLKPSGDDCIVHTAPISSGSTSVFINGIPAGRVGDPTCTAVAEGSPDVFAGG